MSAPLPRSAGAAPAQRSLRILYAEDLSELRELARLSFSREGHRIECVTDGEVAYDRLAADRDFDLVITDHHMPMMNGLELVAELRALNHPARVIVVSSELSPAVDAEYRRMNVDAILYKPVHPGKLRTLFGQLFPDVRPATQTETPANPAPTQL